MKIGQAEAIVEFGGEGFSKDAVAFSFVTLDGQRHEFGMKVEDVPFFIAGMVTLTRQSKELNGPLGEPEMTDEVKTLRGVQTTGVIASEGQTDDELSLLVHTGGFPIKFATTPEAMSSLVADLERLATKGQA
jgi:hypothetical protein